MQAPVFDLNDDCGRDEPATPGKHKQEDSSNSEYSNSVQGKGSPSLTPPHKGRGLLPVALEPTRKGRREGTVQSRFVEMYTTPVKSSQRYGENDRTLTATAVNVSTPIDVPTTTTEASVATTTAMTGCESYDVMYSHHARSFCALEFSSRYLKQIDNPDKEIWETKERCDEELRTIQGKLCGTEAEAVVNELLACGLGDVTSGKFRDASKRVTQYYMKESGKGNLNASTFSKLLLSIARVNRLVEFVQSGVSPRKQSHKENDKIPAIVALPSPLRTSYTAAADQEQRELSTPLPHVQESTGKKCRTPVSSPVQLKSTPLGPNAGTQTQQPGDAQQTLVTPSSQEEHQKQQTHNFSHKKHAITVVPFTTPKRDEDDVDDGECDDKFDADDKEVAVGTLPSSFVAVDSPQVKITPIKSDERYRSPSTGRGAPGGARKVCCRICEQYIPFEDIDKHTKECSKNNSVYAQMNEIKMKIAKFCGLSSSHRSSRSPGARCIHDALRAFVDKCDLDTIDPVFVASAKESRRSVASLLSGNDGGCGGLTPAEAEEVAAILRSLDKFIMLCGNVQGITKSGRSKLSAVTIQDFEFIKSIGKGAFGNVYLSRKKTTGDVYAIKRLNKQQAVLKNQLTHIKAERNILASTDSPFLIRSYFSFQTKDNLYLVMEYAPGGDVYSLLKNLGCLDEEMARTYVAQIVLALGYLHKMNIIHRDLKPDNLLISATGHIKLTDFGLSSYGLIDDNKNGDNNNTFTERTRTRRQPDTNKGSDSDSEPEQTTIAPMVHAPPAAAMSPLRVMGTDTSNTNSVVFHNGVVCSRHKRYSVVGTPDYLAPEVILGIGHDKNVDWWALGVM